MAEIRETRREDLASLREIYNHYVLNTHITFDLEPVGAEDRSRWFQQFNHNLQHRLFTALEDGKVVGYACSSQFRVKAAYDGSVETTIYLRPQYKGSGLGKSLYQHLIAELRNSQVVHRCYGVIALPNDASIGLHQSLGFTLAGRLTEVGYKFDQYWDTQWMELAL